MTIRGTLGTPPWRRAPLLLLRQSPVSFAACAVTTAVLAAAAASGPLFLASTATAALHNEASLECPQASQPAVTDEPGANHYSSAVQRGPRLAALDQQVVRTARAAGLPAPDRVSTATLTAPGGAAFVLSRRGSLRHVRVLDTVGGPGVYVPRSYARQHRVTSGDVLPLGSARVRVAGVYRDLAPSAFVPLFRLPRYWCTWHDDIVPSPLNRPPPMFLGDDATLASARVVDSTWFDATPTSTRTIGATRAALTAMAGVAHRLRGSGLVEVPQARFVVGKAERVRGGLRGPVLPIVFAGCIVAALLVAGAGAFWRLRRGRELQLLSARGVGRGLLATKAVLENVTPVMLGTLAGWAGALLIVRWFGPASQLEAGAPWTALLVAGGAAAGALALLSVVVVRTLAADRSGSPRRVWRMVPWEVGLVALAALAYVQVRDDGAVQVVRSTVQVNPWVIAFPLTAIAGVLLALSRGAYRGVVALPRLATRWPVAGYLAARRIAGTPLVAIGVLIGTALPVAVLVYGSSFTGSTGAAVAAKYRTNLGASYAVGLLTHGARADAGGYGTVVDLIDSDDGPAVLGVDPASFDRFAYGDVAPQVAQLNRAGGAALPVLLVNGRQSVSAIRVRGDRVPVHVVGRSAAFPGLRDPHRPMLVVDRRRLPRLDPYAERTQELWTTPAQLPHALAALARTGVEPNYEIDPDAFLDSTGLRPVTWIFGYLDALAVLTGLTALTGLGLAFAVRTRRRALAYQLARRMGLTRATHRRSVALELGGLLGLAWGTGASVALAAVAVSYRLGDTYPDYPPPPVFPDPSPTLAATLLVIGAVATVATVLVQRALDRADPNALLRT